MNEIESAKETAKELPKETPKTPEVPKETNIQKFYKACALVHNSLFAIFILFKVGAFLSKLIFIKFYYSNISLFSKAYPLGTILFLISITFIVIGSLLYIFYLLSKTKEINKKIGLKFIIRGALGVALVYLIILFMSHLMSIIVGPGAIITIP